MDRSLFALATFVIVAGCEARGAMYAGTNATSKNDPSASNDPPTTAVVGEATASKPVPPPVASGKPASSAKPAPAVDAGPSTTLPKDCSLVCVNANAHGTRLAAADEARLASGLAETAHALEACYPQKPTHTFQLRFNSSAALTGFGVDIEDEDGPACMIDIRTRTPALTMPGPSTIRCTEKCKR